MRATEPHVLSRGRAVRRSPPMSIRRTALTPIPLAAYVAPPGCVAGGVSGAGCPALGPLTLPTRVQGSTAALPGPATSPSGPLRFEVIQNRSTATFRVREQLAGISAPSDAAGCTKAVTGHLTLEPSGEIVSGASR